ncbi:MAG: dihydropteroate synthase [Actinomycetota bacterium]|nr:dihydropteroate synthase [Actinomycetota bacterium]
MGVLNVTPDSFSDGGRYLVSTAAIAHGDNLVAQGAAMLDVGGESTRPHAQPVETETELARVVPVVQGVRAANPDVSISVDTTKSVVAAAGLTAGADLVNDVSAGLDPDMLRVVADHDAGFVAMHRQGTPATMQDDPRYDDVVREVGDFLLARLDAARAAGVRDDALLADPGIGFGKTIDHNLALLAALPELIARVGVPLVVGASRKTFLGTLTGGAPVDDREDATLAVSVWAFDAGVRVVRVHDVAPSARAARLLGTIVRATQDGVAA